MLFLLLPRCCLHSCFTAQGLRHLHPSPLYLTGDINISAKECTQLKMEREAARRQRMSFRQAAPDPAPFTSFQSSSCTLPWPSSGVHIYSVFSVGSHWLLLEESLFIRAVKQTLWSGGAIRCVTSASRSSEHTRKQKSVWYLFPLPCRCQCKQKCIIFMSPEKAELALSHFCSHYRA